MSYIESFEEKDPYLDNKNITTQEGKPATNFQPLSSSDSSVDEVATRSFAKPTRSVEPKPLTEAEITNLSLEELLNVVMESLLLTQHMKQKNDKLYLQKLEDSHENVNKELAQAQNRLYWMVPAVASALVSIGGGAFTANENIIKGVASGFDLSTKALQNYDSSLQTPLGKENQVRQNTRQSLEQNSNSKNEQESIRQKWEKLQEEAHRLRAELAGNK